MKRLALSWIIFLISFNVFAGTCNNGSLVGAYNFEFSGTQPYRTPSGILTYSKHDVGRINFNGSGAVNFSGIDTSGGVSVAIRGSGTYTVNAGCTAFGTIQTIIPARPDPDPVITYWIYLDQMDDVPATSIAYHATMVIKDNVNESASGTLTRMIGKFQ